HALRTARGEHAEAVVLELEDPPFFIERTIEDLGFHRRGVIDLDHAFRRSGGAQVLQNLVRRSSAPGLFHGWIGRARRHRGKMVYYANEHSPLRLRNRFIWPGDDPGEALFHRRE